MTVQLESPARSGARSAVPVVLLGLLAADVVVKVLLLPRAVHAPLQGDEIAYVNAAKVLASVVRDLLTGHHPDLTAIRVTVIGNGWFMPGMSCVLTPLFLMVPHASVEMIRLYIGVLTLVLFLVTVRETRRTLGDLFAGALLVLPGLVPMWVLYSYTVWGDLTAGLLVVIALCWLMRRARAMNAGVAPTVGQGIFFGVLCIATLYVRSSALPLVGGLLGLVFLGSVLALRGRERRHAIASWGCAVLAFGALLLPWSYAASRALDGRVVTTSTVPISVAVAFGDPDDLCFGPCDNGNIWFSMVRYSRQVARATGASELTVQKQMSTYALRDATPHTFARAVLADTHRYVFEPSGFEAVFRNPPGSAPDSTSAVTRWVTDGLYFAFLAVAAVGLLLVRRRRFEDQVLSILVKLMGAALLLQPFLHICSPRYWPVFTPLMAIAAILVVQTFRGHSVEPAGSPLASRTVTTWLIWIQVALVVGWVGTFGLLIMASG